MSSNTGNCEEESVSKETEHKKEEFPETYCTENLETTTESTVAESSSSPTVPVEPMDIMKHPDVVEMFKKMELHNAEWKRVAQLNRKPVPQETLDLHAKIDATLKELEMEDLHPKSICWIKLMKPALVDEIFEECRQQKALGITKADEILTPINLGVLSIISIQNRRRKLEEEREKEMQSYENKNPINEQKCALCRAMSVRRTPQEELEKLMELYKKPNDEERLRLYEDCDGVPIGGSPSTR